MTDGKFGTQREKLDQLLTVASSAWNPPPDTCDWPRVWVAAGA